MPKKAGIKGKDNKNSKHGQAAMEYLMTYGWAILVVLAIVAILAFVVRPRPFETCQTDFPFECVPGSYVMYKDNSSLIISLKNTGREKVNIISTACAYENNTYVGLMDRNLPLSVGEIQNVPFNCTAKADSAAKIGEDVFQGEVFINYNPRSSDTSVTKTTTIRIAAKYS